jgi:hypothetical protein
MLQKLLVVQLARKFSAFYYRINGSHAIYKVHYEVRILFNHVP